MTRMTFSVRDAFFFNILYDSISGCELDFIMLILFAIQIIQFRKMSTYLLAGSFNMEVCFGGQRRKYC